MQNLENIETRELFNDAERAAMTLPRGQTFAHIMVPVSPEGCYSGNGQTVFTVTEPGGFEGRFRVVDPEGKIFRIVGIDSSGGKESWRGGAWVITPSFRL